jgi:hypothetical protein
MTTKINRKLVLHQDLVTLDLVVVAVAAKLMLAPDL